MIGKVSPHGQGVTGLIYYLFGTGSQAEHTDPHIVAGWRHPAELEPPLRDDSRRDFQHLTGLLTSQIQDHPQPPCGCAAQHGGSGRYIFLGPDGGHYRRSNYARRVFRPACDGRHKAKDGRPPKLVIADATTWPGVPIAAWPPADPSADYTPPRGRGIQAIPIDTPLACWLPIKPGLTVHGLRHGHKTWMTEDGIPEVLAEQRLGHQVPGISSLYAHVSDRMRDELKHALQTRWEESLRDRAAIAPRSPLPLLDELLTAEVTHRNQTTPGDGENRN
jgi:hypothetical protein